MIKGGDFKNHGEGDGNRAGRDGAVYLQPCFLVFYGGKYF